MIYKVLTVVVLFATCILLVSCGSIRNYSDALEPRFTGRFSDQPPGSSENIKVVSYNISFGENIDLAIHELSEFEELKDADIILLQEMDEVGTESIAKALDYNFVYYPASLHNRHNKNFGNAILSKWPIGDSEKVVLPYKSPRNQQIRIAVKAVITIDGMEILTYSVHTETFWLGPHKRNAQVDALIESIDTSYQYIIVGGDFNTLTLESVEEVEDSFREIGMERVSKDVGYTAKYASLEFSLDHIFTRGLSLIEAGKVEEAVASDHYPICVTVAP